MIYRVAKFLAFVFALVLFAGVVLMLFTVNATADGGNQTEIEPVDGSTVIVNSSYSEQSGQASITLESERRQDVVITDAGAFTTGGEVERREVTLRPGESATVEMPATESAGRVGLGIETETVLYAHIIEVPDYLFYSEPGWSTVRLVGFGSGGGVLLAVIGEVLRRKFWGRSSARKIA